MSFATCSHWVNLAAACILSGGLIAAATIDSHRPVAAPASGGVAAPCVAVTQSRVLSPLPQEEVQSKIRAQIMADPDVHTFTYKGVKHTLTDASADWVTYSAKDDTFSYTYNLTWSPAMPDDGPHDGNETLENDGFGHYHGSVILRSADGESPASDALSADISIP